MSSNTILDKYLEFENKSDCILSYKFQAGDMLMWPYIRSFLLSYSIIKDAGLDSEAVKQIGVDTRGLKDLKRLLVYLLFLILETTKIVKKFDYIFLNSTRPELKKENNKIINQEYDPYIMIYDDRTLNLEISDRFRINRPRFCKNVRLYDKILIKSNIVGKFKKLNEVDSANIERLIEYIKADFPCKIEENIFDIIRAELIRKSKTIKTIMDDWEKLILKTEAKFAFVECGSYGNPHIFKIMRKYNVVTCEFQHGYLDQKYVEYNLSDRLKNDKEYQSGMPEFLLTYGDYWNSQVRTCCKTITVGNPKIANYRNQATNVRKDKKTITFFSNYLVADKIYGIILDLADNYGLVEKYHVQIKRHPRETENSISKQLEETFLGYGIDIISNKDALEVLIKTDIVVSPESTVIYEATVFCEKVCIFDNGSINIMTPKEVGETFTTAKELYDLIISSRLKEKKLEQNYFFDLNWKENYLKFINDYSKQVK